MTPSWAATARKFLVALAVAVVAAGGIILAALADDRVTASEWVTIVLAILGALVGPAAVYAVPNARVPADSGPNDPVPGPRRVDHLGGVPRNPWERPQ